MQIPRQGSTTARGGAGRDGHDGDPSGVGGAGWAGLTCWELWGAAGGLWALLEGKTEIGGNCLTITPYLLDVDLVSKLLGVGRGSARRGPIVQPPTRLPRYAPRSTIDVRKSGASAGWKGARAAAATPWVVLAPHEHEHGSGGGRRSLAETVTVTSGQASELSSIFNLSNTILGSGTLAMPYACYRCGAAVFVMLLILVGLMANFSLHMLVTCIENSDQEGPVAVPMSYGKLAKDIHSKAAQKVASWAVIVQQFGACVAYIVIIADVVQPIAGLAADSPHSIWCNRAIYQVGIAACIIFPLTMLRSIDSLRFTSLAALACIVAFVVVVSILGIISAIDPHFREVTVMVHIPSSKNKMQCPTHTVRMHKRTLSATLSESLGAWTLCILQSAGIA
jgi:hypothetical protein